MTPKQLREVVAVMRELGVVECDGIKLGPPPVVARASSGGERSEAKRAEPDEVLFAATRMRPRSTGNGTDKA